MVVDGISQRFTFTPDELARLADRKTGIGFDQLLLVEAPTRKDTAFKYRIFNADGSEVSQCGNGARCFAKFVKNQGLTDQNEFWVETNSGRIMLSVLDDGQVRVNMGVPQFSPEHIPLAVAAEQEQYTLEFEGETLLFSALEIGNPHAVFQVDSLSDAPVEALGTYLQSHSLFPERVNVGFYQRLSGHEIKLRVFERGVGETKACGSGACAAVIAGYQQGVLAQNVRVNVLGGCLQIETKGADSPVTLTGSATQVYHGKLDIGFL